MSELQIPPPGEQRNWLLAEKVFGWRWAPEHNAYFGADGEMRFAQSWSTDDAASLDVIHTMRARDYWFDIRWRHWVTVRCGAGNRLPEEAVTVNADKLAAAVTEAALRALEGGAS